jgi:hypothetical protein
VETVLGHRAGESLGGRSQHLSAASFAGSGVWAPVAKSSP